MIASSGIWGSSAPTTGSSPISRRSVARSKLEATLRERMDEDSPCSLLNMENQLITGYDDTGFDTAQPWYPHNKDFPPRRLSSGTWT